MFMGRKNLFESSWPVILKNLVGAPLYPKSNKLHEYRNRIIPLFRELPFHHPRALFNDPGPDEPAFFEFLQPQGKDAGCETGNGATELIETVDLSHCDITQYKECPFFSKNIDRNVNRTNPEFR